MAEVPTERRLRRPRCWNGRFGNRGSLDRRRDGSVVKVLATIVSLSTLVIVDRRAPGSAAARRIGLFLLAALIGTSVWTTAAVAIDSTEGAGEVGIGVAQRFQLVAIAGWLIFVAARTAHGRM